jgi:hypothetical protein
MKKFTEFLTESANLLKIRKVNKDWYQIDIEKDKWDIATKVVAIFKTEHNEWSVNDGEPEHARKIGDLRRYVFVKLSSAKIFALDLADAVKHDKPYPRFSDSKYDL